MYKSKLQELCQRRGWGLPEYTTVKDGPDHMPHFTARVTVRGEVFDTPGECRSSKDAQNTVAKLALDLLSVPNPYANANCAGVGGGVGGGGVTSSQFQMAASLPVSPLPSSLPLPTPRFLAAKNEANAKPSNGDVLEQNSEDAKETPRVILQQNSEDTNPLVYNIAICNDKNYKATLHMYKNRLQQYAQKKGLGFPVYTCEAEGPPHARRFKSRVSFGGKSYETMEFFPTLKEAEQQAAKVVCQVLSVDVNQEDGGLYKNLLQEFVQKMGLQCPSYETNSSGLSRRSLFLSTVEIGNDTFRGAEAKTKKEAETNAAKVAYCALTEKLSATESSMISPIKEHASADTSTQVIEPTATVKKQEDATEEIDAPEGQIHSKKAKSLSEDMNVDAHLPRQLDGSNLLHPEVENFTSAEPVTKEPSENQSSKHMKIVVQPRRSSLPIPGCATVMPCSNEEWVTYKLEMD